MKKHAIILLALSLPCLVLAQEPSPYGFNPDNFSGFRWTRHAVGPDGGDTFRSEFDFTVPVHGPWLTNPSQNSGTVTWITEDICAAGIEYRERGTEAWTRQWQTYYGMLDYSRDLHTIHFEGLKPGTAYEYRLLNEIDKHYAGYTAAYAQKVFIGQETYCFQTLDPARTEYSVFFTSDTHGSSLGSLVPSLTNACKNVKPGLYCFLGDNVTDNMNNPRHFLTRGYLDEITHLWGTSQYTVVVRGNHDSWGRRAHEFGDYFPRKDEKTYYAFSQGGVLFVVLDAISGVPEKIANGQHSEEGWRVNIDYVKEQNEWLKQLKKTEAWKKAEFRVAMAHYPVLGRGPKGGDTPRDCWTELLDESPQGRIHAYFCGHEHRHVRVNPKATSYQVGELPAHAYAPDGKNPFVHVVLNQLAAIRLDVRKGVLAFHAYDFREGTLVDAFEILPNGSVRELKQ